MNLEEYLVQDKKDAIKLTVEFNDEPMDFYVRPIMGLQQQQLLKAVGGAVALHQKIQKAEAQGIDYPLTGDDLVQLDEYKAKQALIMLCNKKGKPLFRNLNSLLTNMEPDLIRVVGERIDEHLKSLEKSNNLEEAEKK